YFQAKLDRRREATAAAACMRNVVLACCAFGYVFYATDMAWSMWRLYDLALLALALYAWASALRTRGIRLVDERLAQVGELERSAEKYRQMAEHLPDIVW